MTTMQTIVFVSSVSVVTGAVVAFLIFNLAGPTGLGILMGLFSVLFGVGAVIRLLASKE